MIDGVCRWRPWELCWVWCCYAELLGYVGLLTAVMNLMFVTNAWRIVECWSTNCDVKWSWLLMKMGVRQPHKRILLLSDVKVVVVSVGEVGIHQGCEPALVEFDRGLSCTPLLKIFASAS